MQVCRHRSVNMFVLCNISAIYFFLCIKGGFLYLEQVFSRSPDRCARRELGSTVLMYASVIQLLGYPLLWDRIWRVFMRVLGPCLR